MIELHDVAVLRRGDRGAVPGVGGGDAPAPRAGRAAGARRAAAAPLPLRHAVSLFSLLSTAPFDSLKPKHNNTHIIPQIAEC